MSKVEIQQMISPSVESFFALSKLNKKEKFLQIIKDINSNNTIQNLLLTIIYNYVNSMSSFDKDTIHRLIILQTLDQEIKLYLIEQLQKL